MCVDEKICCSRVFRENYHASDVDNVSFKSSYFNCTKSWKIIVVLSEKNSAKTCVGAKFHACARRKFLIILKTFSR